MLLTVSERTPKEKRVMSFTKKACLATLLLSLPLAVPAQSMADDWDENKAEGSSGSVVSSGSKVTFPQEEAPEITTYETVYTGHAIHSGTNGKAESGSNTGTLSAGFTVAKAMYGGCSVAESYGASATAAEAKGNKLVLQKGSALQGTDNYSPELYGGYAESRSETGTADASGNKITIEAGAAVTALNDYTTYVYGGMACLTDAKAESQGTALDNAVTIKAGAAIETRISVYGGYAMSEQGIQGSGSVSASGNTVTIENLASGQITTLFAGYACSNNKADAVANGNHAVLVLGDEVRFGDGLGKGTGSGYAFSENGKAEASDNTLDLTGAVLSSDPLYTGYAESKGISRASGNITTLASITAKHEKNEFAGGYAEGGSGDAKVYADGNVTTIADSTMRLVQGGLAYYGTYLSASGNALTITGGSSEKVYAGRALTSENAPYGKEAYASNNTLTLKDTTASQAWAGYAICYHDGDSEASQNGLEVQDGTIETGLYAGFAEGRSATASGNYGSLSNVTLTDAEHGDFAGGYALATGESGTAAASQNVFAIESSQFASIFGGRAEAPDGAKAVADGNSLALTDVTVGGELYAGYASTEGSSATNVSASGNTLVLKGSTASSVAYAGYAVCITSADADASQNTLEAEDSTVETMLYAGFAAGQSATASGNHGSLSKVTVSDAEHGDFAGGYALASGDSGTAAASQNVFAIESSQFASIYGGMAQAQDGVKAEADSNSLVLTDVQVGRVLYAGYASAEGTSATNVSASGNTLVLKGSTASSEAYAGYALCSDSGDAAASKNGLEVQDSTIETYLYAGFAQGRSATASENYGSLSNVTVSDADSGDFAGGYAAATGDSGSATASLNAFTIEGGQFASIFGGRAEAVSGVKAEADGNSLALRDVQVQGDLYAGYASAEGASATDASASGNMLVLNGGIYAGSVYGGYADAGSGSAAAGSNAVELRKGASGKNPVFADTSVIQGGYAGTGGTSSGNSLSLYGVTGITAGNVANFQKLNYTYDALNGGEEILTLKGTAGSLKTDISEASVTVSVLTLAGADGGEFREDDKVILLQNGNGLVADNLETAVTTHPTTGISLEYDIEVQTNATELFLQRKGEARVLPGTKAIAEGAAAGLALASESANAAAEALRELSMASGSIAPFMHVQASSLRHETGSHVSLSAVSLVAGLGTGFGTGAGKLSAGGFFEYGKGSYTTHNSFDSRADADGDGTSWYMGGGIMARMDFKDTGPGHFYAEGTAHMGALHNEYDSNDLADAHGNVARFDMDSPYYSLHAGAGYVWNMAEGHDLDIHARYIWTQVQGTDVTLTTKDRFSFDDMNSNRVLAGVRYSYTGSERFKPYIGLAYEHEFAGSCESATYGHPVAAPSFEGGTGIGELGVAMMPTEALPLSFNLGVQGYVGQKQGISGNCNIMYEF